MDGVKRIWYLSPMRAVSQEEPSDKARSLAPLIGWACAVKVCHDGMLEDTNSLDGAHMKVVFLDLYTIVNIFGLAWWLG